MKTLGIIGGGQLGRMICFYAQMMGLRTVVFTDQKDSPASFVTNQTIVGDYLDKIVLKKFCDAIDFATFEFENIPLETAEFIAQNSQLYPNVETLKIVRKNNIKTRDEYIKFVNKHPELILRKSLKQFPQYKDADDFFDRKFITFKQTFILDYSCC
jgi:phosphoribosylaminoimidazole carboxylase (NCAIR synthetase)